MAVYVPYRLLSIEYRLRWAKSQAVAISRGVGRLEPGYRVLFWLPVGSKVMADGPHASLRRSPNETGRATGRAVCVSLGLGAAPGSGWRDGAVSDRAARPGEDRSAAQ